MTSLGHLPLGSSLAASTVTSGISLTDALLLLVFAGVIAAAYQVHMLFRRLDALEERLIKTPARLALPGAGPAAPTSADAGVSLERVAVIAAAVHVALGRPVRIVSITDGADAKQVWSLEGRRQIFASHQVR